MIELYAIINDGHTMQTYIRSQKNRREMQAIVSYAVKQIQTGQSKIIKSIKIGSYYLYYFRQASFIFMLATQLKTRVNRMQTYLRVVADIFYQNYDQKKFHYVLERIMEEINKIQFGSKKQNHLLEDQESSLVGSVIQQKNKLNSLIQKRKIESIRAYIITTILFISILVLGISYLTKNWA